MVWREEEDKSREYIAIIKRQQPMASREPAGPQYIHGIMPLDHTIVGVNLRNDSGDHMGLLTIRERV